MEIRTYDKNSNGFMKKTKWQSIFEEFLGSGASKAKLEYKPGEFKSSTSAYMSEKAAERKYKYAMLKVVMDGENIYIVRKEAI